MNWLTRFIHKSRANRQLDSELRFHLEQQISDYIAFGLSPDEARRRARLDFGGLDQVKEQVHASRRGYFLETLLQDIRYGLRMLRKSPGFTIVAVVTLALGIGANAAVFSVMNALLLRPLPVTDPHQLVQLSQSDTHGNRYLAFAHPIFKELAKNNQSLNGVAAFLYLPRPVAAIFEGRAELASAMLASDDYFSVLGVSAVQGRVFTTSDGAVGKDHLAVISYGYWTRRFNRDPKIIGKNISINESLFTIVGITPADFYGVDVGRSPDLTIPETMQPELISVGGQSFLDNPNVRWVEVIARLRTGTAPQAAQADLSRIVKQTNSGKGDVLHLEVLPFAGGLNSDLRGRFGLPLEILLALTMLVLLVACANVGAMLLVRGQGKRHEIAVRSALGASTKRLFQQLFTESAILAGSAGLAGLLVGFWCSRALVRLISTATAPASLNVPFDFSVLAFTAAVSFLACITFGMIPTFQALSTKAASALNQGTVTATNRRSPFGIGGYLLSSQIGVSVVLLVVAGLFVQTLRDLSRVDLGFDPHNVLLFSWDPRPSSGNANDRLNDLYLRLLRRLRAEPGILSTTFSTGGPMAGGWGQQIVGVDDAKTDINVMQAAVGPGYFETLHIPVLQGRDFAGSDGPTSPLVAVLSQGAARAVFGTSSPIGRHIRVAGAGFNSPSRVSSTTLEVVGLVRDTKFDGIRNIAPPVVYTSYLQRTLGAVTFELRTEANPSTFENVVRRDASAIDMSAPVFGVETMNDYLYDLLRNPRILATFATIFSLFILTVVALGLYGSLSYAVARRTHEIGVRIALGAQKNCIFGIVLWRGLLLGCAGIVVGVVAGLGLTRLISSELWGVSATDPTTFSASVVFLTIVIVAACYIPARRATRVDPMVALRYE